MAYATKQDLIDRFGELELIQLTDRTIPPVAIDDDVMARSLGDAAATIDSYLGKVYALPLAAVPPVLVKVGCDLARYFLYGHRADKDGGVERAYLQAIGWLKDVSRGLVSLDVGGAVPAQAGGGSIRAEGPERVFSRDSLRGL
ncbi:MAG: hypothetical protein ABS35_19575 [Kaistia sp. SCN 65-12]|uniref:gp436 family protein n=1 Tax=Bosea sp. (in: a-proteobacteria) TaxID=1871050 RepID=UPI00086962B4|nr:DUF1320 domain-containing protein [Bosea sp. (in: a-proteobacteria)]MBN9471671.1 DUF1320 domain-containing protein [Bosea sp. (in: a-proteobacteria)]ODT20469.1 MAG: hypothetical protein ABS35_19575 [Kaistia sp. SCN 65-12]